MTQKQLGKHGPQVSALSLGSHSAVNTPQSDAELVATIHAALDAGINFLNTGGVRASSQRQHYSFEPSRRLSVADVEDDEQNIG